MSESPGRRVSSFLRRRHGARWRRKNTDPAARLRLGDKSVGYLSTVAVQPDVDVQRRSVREAMMLVVIGRRIGKRARLRLLNREQPRRSGRVGRMAQVVHRDTLLEAPPLIAFGVGIAGKWCDASGSEHGGLGPQRGSGPLCLGL